MADNPFKGVVYPEVLTPAQTKFREAMAAAKKRGAKFEKPRKETPLPIASIGVRG